MRNSRLDVIIIELVFDCEIKSPLMVIELNCDVLIIKIAVQSLPKTGWR